VLVYFQPLLTNTQNGQAMLAISSLVNTYCKTSPCANDLDMINLVSSLEDKINVGCFADKNNINNVRKEFDWFHIYVKYICFNDFLP
jgi:hypothetical protein